MPTQLTPELKRELEAVLAARAVASEDDTAAKWRAGDLRWKLHAHQLRVYDAFQEWDARRRTPQYTEVVKLRGAQFYDVWSEEIARRWGKTTKWLVILFERCIRRPGSVFTYATAHQKDIGGIVVKLAEMLAADAPRDVRPEYQGSKEEDHEGLFFPNGSVIKLVGIDVRPKALRGQFSDGIVISEAGHVIGTQDHPRGLEATVRSVLIPQFQRRPWAFLALETSSPEDPEHDFLRLFRPDSELRDAYIQRTIDDNDQIDEVEKDRFITEAGGRGHRVCEREYYNVVSRDPSQYVIPEFDEKQHVRKVTLPEYSMCYTAGDPGSQDLFGLVFGFYHFGLGKLVVQASWAQRNASTRQAACVVAFYEWLLWGRAPDPLMRDIPLRETRGRKGWLELLVGTKATEEQAAALWGMCQREDVVTQWRPGQQPKGRTLYWDGSALTQNPFNRVSDVDLRFVQDLAVEYGLTFSPTRKDDAEAQRQSLRDAIGAGSVIFSPDAGPVIAHVRNAIWNDRRTDWQRHAVFGHYDCLAALIYMWRNVDRGRNPNIPALELLNPHSEFINAHDRKRIEQVDRDLEAALFGGSTGDRVLRTMRLQKEPRRRR